MLTSRATHPDGYRYVQQRWGPDSKGRPVIYLYEYQDGKAKRVGIVYDRDTSDAWLSSKEIDND